MRGFGITAGILLIGSISWGQSTSLDAAKLLENFSFRSLGPSVTGGRIIDIEAHPSQPMTFYAAAATGGLWKTTNGGVTFKCVFENENRISLGDAAIAPSDPNIVWVGTGENNNQRSAHYGDGVYKSTDGGTTWKNMGLPDSMRVGRIQIDPKNPNTVYVAAMGLLYKPGGGKGVYKTTDGGTTWERVLQGENDTTGFIELVIDPKNEKTLYAASLDRLRRPWNIRETGPGSAIYKSTDAGKTWKKLTGGLPTGQLGRIGLTIHPEKTNILYANVIEGGRAINMYRTDDAGTTWKKVNDANVQGGSYYGQVRVDPKNPDVLYNLGTRLQKSVDGGKTYRIIDQRIHVDHHGLWINPGNTNHVILGNDGGLYISYDGGENWHFGNNLPIAQFYAGSVDNATPYNVMGGLQDNGGWRGPSRTRKSRGIDNSDWINIVGGDGFYSLADPEDPNTIYTSSQFGGFVRFDAVSRTSRFIRPRDQGLRANWMTPFFVSPHNNKTIYWGAQRVFRSYDRGNTWLSISPDLTTNNATKIAGNVPHCTITTMEESPRRAGVIWAGTDDGNIWVTQNGTDWTQVNGNIPNLPKEWWVSRVHASPHDVATAFVTVTGFREDEFTPLIYKTTDFGKTWTSIASNLPQEQLCVVKQDTINPDLLFLGTESGFHISLDGGASWIRWTKGVPNAVPVQDLAVQNRDGDVVLFTHGRGVFVMNVSPFRQMTKEIAAKPAHLYKPDRALAYSFFQNMFDEFLGASNYTVPNPAYGAKIYYHLTANVTGDVKIEIVNIEGNVVTTLTGVNTAGLNSVTWAMQGPVRSGQYLVRLNVGGQLQTQTLEVVDWIRAPQS